MPCLGRKVLQKIVADEPSAVAFGVYSSGFKA
jgi:hypothetical protein